jgi:CRISPR/Cas system CSM-associated protein Csm4 (group 5 of RAMP superfamily)
MDPEPLLEKTYYQIANLYNENDPLIRFVRAIQNGDKAPLPLAEALRENENDSIYSKDVRKSYLNVKALNDFFSGNITKEEAYDITEMDKKFRF